MSYPPIGKAYLRRRDIEFRTGYCKFCGTRQELISFNTDLWYLIVFVPAIPLGRKRVFEFCPSCCYHFSCDWKTWEMGRHLEVSGALYEYQRNPNADTAIQLHLKYLNFYRIDEATKFETKMDDDFSRSARIQAYLGDIKMEQGKEDPALNHYRRALALRPDLPEAKIALAYEAIRNDQLGEARIHLKFLTQPGASQLYPMEPLNALANAFIRAKRLPEAIEIFSILLDAFPEAAQNSKLRSQITKLEKEAGKKVTILPRRKFFNRGKDISRDNSRARRIYLWVFAIVLFIALVLTLDKAARAHRTVYLYNGLSQPVTLQAGGMEFTVNKGVQTIELPEGPQHFVIGGERKLDGEIAAQRIFRGIFGRPAWLLDVGNNTLFSHETRRYSHEQKTEVNELVWGGGLRPIPTSDLLFEPFPAASNEKQLTRFGVYSGTSIQAATLLINNKLEKEAIYLIEDRLGSSPVDLELFRFYCTRYANSPEYSERVRKFLQDGLSRRPLEFGWHQYYQDMLLRAGERANLVQTYDNLLQADPDNAALLYLRSRVADLPEEMTEYLRRAVQNDEKNTSALYALGYQELLKAQFAEATPRFRKLTELDPASPAYFEMYILSLRAEKRFPEAEELARKRANERPAESAALLDVLLETGRTPEAEEIVSKTAVPGLRQRFLYQARRFEELEKTTSADTPDYYLAVLTQLNKLDEAEEFVKAKTPGDAFRYLALSLAHTLSGNSKSADRTRAQAIEILARDPDPDMKRAAELLDPKDSPAPAALHQISVSIRNKALLAAWLAVKYPKVPELGQISQSLNIDRTPPHALIEKALTPKPAKH